MSEKQAKRARQEESQQPSLAATISFQRNEQGVVSVNGHIGNPIATFDIIGKGCMALASFYAGQAKEAQFRIVRPNLQDVKAVGRGK